MGWRAESTEPISPALECAVAVFMDNQFPQCSANASCSVFLAAFFMTKFRSKQIVPVIVICELRN
jgi:hypothetical protein